MSWVATAIVGSAVVGGVAQDRAAGEMSESAERTGAAQIAEQRAAREAFEERTQPFLDIGLGAGEQLQSLLAGPNQTLEQINPVASFLQEQGFRDIREGSVGRNPDQDLSRFQTGLTSTLVPQFQNQRFNQLFNVLGLGSNAATGQGQAALQTGANIGNIMGNVGQAQQAGIAGQANALTGTIQNVAGGLGAFPGLFNAPSGDFAGAQRPTHGAFGTGGAQQGPIPSTGVF